ALEGIRRTDRYFQELPVPTGIPELLGRPLTERELAEMTEKCTLFGKIESVGTFQKLFKRDIAMIYGLANQ
ncbi:MAG: NADH-dependent alcohol dehydrogenase, partial [Clostridium sp.]|nr:NADH-dependent alcohol dehydrogenase [Clostridium sp.]